MKVKECCCGCTLRTGTLIISWIGIVEYAVASLTFLLVLLKVYEPTAGSSKHEAQIAMTIYYLLHCTVAAVISILGVVAVHKNQKKLLQPTYYYLIYDSVFTLITLVILLFDSSFYTWLKLSKDPLPTDELIVSAFTDLFLIALQLYFAVVVKSYYRVMEANNVDTGFSAPDLVTIGLGEA